MPIIAWYAASFIGGLGAVAVVVDQTGDAVEQTGNAALKFAVFAAVAAGAYVVIKGAK